MSKKSFIDSVKVGEACSKDWEKMDGNNRFRFCSHCSKHVNNLSEMTRKEAARFVLSSNKDICIRYIANPVTQRPVFAEQLFKITRVSPRLSAGVMTASLGFSTMAYSQSEPPSIPRTEDPPVVIEVIPERKTDVTSAEEPSEEIFGTIEGTIWNLKGKPVAGVEIRLVNPETRDYQYTETDEKGMYRFRKLKEGSYILRMYTSDGLDKKIAPAITVSGPETLVQNLNVRVVKAAEGDGETISYGSGIGGAMAMIEYKSPLAYAVASDEIEAVRKLLVEGANVNGRDANYDNITPLFLAVENGNVEITKLLLEFGAKVNAVDNTKRTPLMSIDYDATPELIKLLANEGARINAIDDEGNSALLKAVGMAKADVILALIEAGANVNLANDDQETPLLKASVENEIEIVEALIMAGADVNARDKSGQSSWDRTSNVHIENLLVNYGAVFGYGNISIIAPVKPEKEN